MRGGGAGDTLILPILESRRGLNTIRVEEDILMLELNFIVLPCFMYLK